MTVCSRTTYVRQSLYTYSYCPDGYNYMHSVCCNHAWTVGGSCLGAFLAILLLVALVYWNNRRRK